MGHDLQLLGGRIQLEDRRHIGARERHRVLHDHVQGFATVNGGDEGGRHVAQGGKLRHLLAQLLIGHLIEARVLDSDGNLPGDGLGKGDFVLGKLSDHLSWSVSTPIQLVDRKGG